MLINNIKGIAFVFPKEPTPTQMETTNISKNNFGFGNLIGHKPPNIFPSVFPKIFLLFSQDVLFLSNSRISIQKNTQKNTEWDSDSSMPLNSLLR